MSWPASQCGRQSCSHRATRRGCISTIEISPSKSTDMRENTAAATTATVQENEIIIAGKRSAMMIGPWRRQRPIIQSKPVIFSLLILISQLCALRSAMASSASSSNSSKSDKDVIPSTAFKQTTAAQQPLLAAASDPQTTTRFKYHLNHLQPPSLVPITIQQQVAASAPASSPSAAQSAQPQGHRRARQTGSSQSDEQSRLVQLQLPLQLHLKLRPLPLPLPPPPSTPASDAAAASALASTQPRPEETLGPLPADRKRRDSLEQQLQQQQPLTRPATTTTEPPPTTATSTSTAAPPTTTRPARDTRERLMASTWQEAKRVLLLNAIGSDRQARLERRFAADLTLGEPSGPEAGSARRIQGAPTEAAAPEAALMATTMANNQENSPTLAMTTPGSSAVRDSTATTEAITVDDFRRQRHSSQQEQLKLNLQGQPEMVGGSMQALAAAMLPFFWPSYQLVSSGQQQPQSSWPMKYTQPRSRPIGGRQHQAADSAPPPTIVSFDSEPLQATTTAAAAAITTTAAPPPAATLRAAETTPNSLVAVTTNPAPPSSTTVRADKRVPRKKRRKPVYLNQQSQTQPSYPDSVRLASKYPMPKIKFQQLQATSESEVGKRLEPAIAIAAAVTAASAGQEKAPEKANAGAKTIPNSLSKLIEQQFLNVNASQLLKQHKANANWMGKDWSFARPKTSVSKVVRLNDTKLQIAMSQSSTTSGPLGSELRRAAVDLKRQPTTTTQRPTTTTPMTTTTERLLAAEQLNTSISSTTTTKPPQPTTTGLPERPAGESGYRGLQAPASSDGGNLEEPIVSNKVIQDDEEANNSSISSGDANIGAPMGSLTGQPAAPKKFGLAAAAGREQQQQQSQRRQRKQQQQQQQAANSNIKLFHFKRKPDVKKLPFYKKPLNYTELGWTNEQIAEHLESLGLLAESTLPNNGNGTNSLLLSSPDDQPLGGSQPEVGEHLLLLKRKRRGKNQFERLMAELHGDEIVSLTNVEQPSALSADSQQFHEQGVVPAQVKQIRAAEPLVMKPMFFVMNNNNSNNQKARGALTLAPPKNPAEGVESQQEGRAASALMESNTAASGAQLPEESTLSPALFLNGALSAQGDSFGGNRSSSSKPIIRMRRKHHGDQPLVGQQPWRPSKPLWSWTRPVAVHKQPQVQQLQQQSLMLVPSGLLTPSGSQLVPLYTAETRQDPGADSRVQLAHGGADFFAWRPAEMIPALSSQHRQQHPRQSRQREPKPSGGLAPAGDESFLLAPSTPQLSQQSAGERLVLVASSLGSQRSALFEVAPTSTSTTSTTSTTTTPRPQPQTTGRELRVPKLLVKPMRPAKYSLNGYIPKPSLSQQQQRPKATRTAQRQQSQRPNLRAPKLDLDSSTSNEIFSRRRGFQQQANSSALLLKSMEEKKRKYIEQQQQQLAPKSPTLSLQKVNQIKAKLGLLVSSSTPRSKASPLATGDQQQQAAANIAQTADPSNDNSSSQPQHQNHQSTARLLIGAPLNSIPKTDFECTDKRGRFVSGLFADFKTGCQVWHLCSNNRKYSFLCPSGTIFNAKLRICDWRYNVKCETPTNLTEELVV